MENVDDDREGVRVFNLSSPVAGFVSFSGTNSTLKRRRSTTRLENDLDDDDGDDDSASVARATRGGNT